MGARWLVVTLTVLAGCAGTNTASGPAVATAADRSTVVATSTAMVSTSSPGLSNPPPSDPTTVPHRPVDATIAPLALDGWQITTASIPADGPMAWVQRLDRTSVLFTGIAGFLASDGTSQVHLAILRVPAEMISEENATWSAVESWARQSSGAGTSATDAIVLVQPAVEGFAESQPFTAWYDDGGAFVAWGSTAGTQRFTEAYITAQHEHTPFTSPADAEGDLVHVYSTIPLLESCALGSASAVTADADTLEAADSWRTAMPFAQHFGRRLVICRGAPKAMLTIVEVHPDAVDNVDPQTIVADQVTGTVQMVGQSPAATVDHGLLWFQEGRIYILKALRTDAGDTASSDELTDMMMAIILQSH